MCRHTDSLIYSLDGYLDCFWFLPITNKAAMNILVQDFQSINIFISHG